MASGAAMLSCRASGPSLDTDGGLVDVALVVAVVAGVAERHVARVLAEVRQRCPVAAILAVRVLHRLVHLHVDLGRVARVRYDVGDRERMAEVRIVCVVHWRLRLRRHLVLCRRVGHQGAQLNGVHHMIRDSLHRVHLRRRHGMHVVFVGGVFYL